MPARRSGNSLHQSTSQRLWAWTPAWRCSYSSSARRLGEEHEAREERRHGVGEDDLADDAVLLLLAVAHLVVPVAQRGGCRRRSLYGFLYLLAPRVEVVDVLGVEVLPVGRVAAAGVAVGRDDRVAVGVGGRRHAVSLNENVFSRHPAARAAPPSGMHCVGRPSSGGGGGEGVLRRPPAAAGGRRPGQLHGGGRRRRCPRGGPGPPRAARRRALGRARVAGRVRRSRRRQRHRRGDLPRAGPLRRPGPLPLRRRAGHRRAHGARARLGRPEGPLAAAHPRRRPRSGASCSPSPMPGPTSPGCAAAPSATASGGPSRDRRRGAAGPTTPPGACCWPAPIRTCRSTPASPRSGCPWTRPGWRCGRCAR